MADARLTPPSVGPSFARCGACRHDYNAESWRALDVVETLSSREVQSHVTVWPADVSIEVRRCRSCGELVARKARRSA